MQFSATELLNMRVAQTEHMLDTGLVQTRTQTVDTFGQAIETFADGAATICGIDMRSGSERHGAALTISQYDATVRLPITATPTVGDRFKVTKLFGETLATALVFNIVSPIQRGPSGIRLMLARVET